MEGLLRLFTNSERADKSAADAACLHFCNSGLPRPHTSPTAGSQWHGSWRSKALLSVTKLISSAATEPGFRELCNDVLMLSQMWSQRGGAFDQDPDDELISRFSALRRDPKIYEQLISIGNDRASIQELAEFRQRIAKHFERVLN